MAWTEAHISVLGMFQYDNRLFDGLRVPAGFSADDVRDSVLLECAELEVTLPDWDLLHGAIGLWSRTRLHEWERMARALTEDYNPLHNYDRLESWTETSDGEQHNRGTDSTQTAVNGFNDNADRDSATMTLNDDHNDRRRNVHEGHLRGNIGVTKSSEMLQDELNVRAADLYQIIVREFKERYCVLVY